MSALRLDSHVSFEYQVTHAQLTAELSATFFQSAPDTALDHFLSRSRSERAGTVKTFAFRGLRRVLSDYDAYGLLRMYRLHLLSSEQWAAALGRDLATTQGSLLDIGAGDGGVTRFARPLFARVVVTESARALQTVLRRNRFELTTHDLGIAPWPHPERFDVVSLLNVLDRTLYPRTLLRNACAALNDDGLLLLSVPLPLRAHVHVGPDTVDPEEPMPDTDSHFEASAVTVAEQVLAPAGLRIQRWTRLPYVSQGDKLKPFYVLDAAVFTCAKIAKFSAAEP